MSCNFENPMNEKTAEMFKDMFSDQIEAMDEQTVLLKDFEVKQSEMLDIANAAGQPVTVEINDVDEIKTMGDGTQYKVTSQGWRKVC